MTGANRQNYDKLWIVVACLLVLSGLSFLVTMPRQEDPQLKERFSTLVYVFPGATATTMQQLVVKPIEDELAEVQDVKTVQTTARSQSGIVQITLQDNVDDLDQAWIDVDEALERASREFPGGVMLDSKSKGLELESIVLGVRRGESPLDTLDAARRLRDEILKYKDVAKVKLIGQTAEELVIEIKDEDLTRRGLSLGAVVAQIQAANSAQASGSVQLANRRAEFVAATSFESLAEIKDLRLDIPSGETLSLGSLAEVKRGFKQPQDKDFRFQGRSVVGLGIVARDAVNIVDFGQNVRGIVQAYQQKNPEVEVNELAYQPARTELRLRELFESLLIGMITVGILLIFWMGWRTSLIVSLSLPSISLIGLAVYGMAGGVLHQISIAAFLVSIGQFIDNIIVIVESTQKKMSDGLAKGQAILASQQELRRPMIFATGTGIAAFIPMLAAQGPTADFTMAFPIVAILTLLISYFFSIQVVPALMSYGLKGPERPRRIPGLPRVADFFVYLAQEKSWRVLGLSLLFLLGSGLAFVQVKKQFFPAADRNEFLFTLQLPEASLFSETERLVESLEKRLLTDDRVKEVVTTIGGGMPRFYYNLPAVFESPHVAQVLISTRSRAWNTLLGQELEDWIDQEHPEALGMARYLEQGPPLVAPIEIRVYGDDVQGIAGAIQELQQKLSGLDGIRSLRDTLGVGVPRFREEAWDNNGSQLGFDRRQLSLEVLKRTQGIPLGTYRGGADLVPLTIRGPSVATARVEDVLNAPLLRSREQAFSIDQFASFNLEFAPGLIERRNRQAYHAVLGDLKQNASFDGILKLLKAELAGIEKRQAVRIEIGGESEGSGEANLSILKVAPLALLVLIVCLLAEFHSFRKLLIVFLALPFVMTGVGPGLWIGQSAFGFMSLLGVLALMGIVVNNVILILEALQAADASGLSEEQVIREAISSRIRPIFLTTLLTLVGLLPLALENSTLWPPLAWAMISGLIASTFSTLVVVPTLYRVFFLRRKDRHPLPAGASPAVLGFFLALTVSAMESGKAQARTAASLDALLDLAEESPLTESLDQQHEAARFALERHVRGANSPQAKLAVSMVLRDDELRARSAFGTSQVENQNFKEARLEVHWPLYNPRLKTYATHALEQNSEGARLDAEFQKMKARLMAGEALYELAKVRSLQRSLRKSQSLLKRQSLEVERQIILGRLGMGDRARMDLERSRLENQIFELKEIEASFHAILGRFSLGPQQIPEDFGQAGRLRRLPRESSEPRQDLLSLDARERSIVAQAQGVDSSYFPDLGVYAASTHSDRADLENKVWQEIGLTLRWNIYDGGSRQAEKSSLEAQRKAVQAQKVDRILEIEQDAAREEARLSALMDQQERALQLRRLAEKAVSAERESFRAGRGTLQDLLANESLLREIEIELSNIPFVIYQSCMRIQFLRGLRPRSQCQGMLEAQ